MPAAAQDIDYKVLYEQAQAVIEQLQFKASALEHQLAQIKKMVFGSKHERFVPSDTTGSLQLSLGLDAETIAACKITGVTKVEYVRTKTEVIENKKTHPGRMKLPEHLRRETIILQPETDVTHLKKIGEEVTEILDIIPGELYVKQYIRPKYVAPVSETNTTVITASLPNRIVEKSMAAEGLLAQIIVDKYVDHLPLHRQLQRFQRAGVTIAQSTINGWMTLTLEQFLSLFELHKNQVLSSYYLHADETTIKVLDRDKPGATHQGYYWLYHNSKDKIVLFDYRKGRSREGPDDILKDFKGFLQTDGYVAYESFEKREGITVLNCIAHARRKFVDALQNDKHRCEHALALFQELYAIERKAKQGDLSADAIVALRQDKSVAVLKELKEWMIAEYPKVLPSSVIGNAMAYSLKRWEKLCVYATDGRLCIDNNPVENAVRPVAIGRKNYLFAGSHEAAQRAAMIYSLLATCRLHNINPYTWLKDVLVRMPDYDVKNLAELLPQNWKKPEA
ncbi:MAG: IS66 family transposase [Nocardioidaceae bacterium]